MTADTFLQNFDLLADAPGGVPKLRELILQLAVRGRLVPQEEGEIHHEGHEEHEGWKGKATKVDGPYPVPAGWRWATLGSVVDYNCGAKTSSSLIPADAWLLDLEDIEKDTSRLVQRTVAGDRQSKSTKSQFRAGEVLYGKLRPYLNKVLVADVDGFCTTEIVPMRPSQSVDAGYVLCLLKSRYFLDYTAACSYGVKMPRLGTDDAKKAPFPRPPLAEQKRIVARVDELMKRCDELEVRQTERNESRKLLVSSCLHSLTAPSSSFSLHPSSFSTILHPSTFNLLLDTPESVAELRKTILQLAVQGRLVPQDAKDEPAALLLKTIRADMKASPTMGRRKRISETPQRNEPSTPFELPHGWAWARFSELGEFGRGKSKHRPRNDPALYRGGTYRMVQTGDVARAEGVVTTYTALYNETGLSQSRMWPAGTMCITIAANIADSAILGFDACFPDSVVGFVPSPRIGDAQYFEFFVRTAKERLTDYAPSTAQKNINMGILNAVMIPLPPIRELKRIVVKVNELMALCDALEARLIQSREDADTLAAAVVHHLCNRATHQEGSMP